MAEILVASRGEPQAKKLIKALNAKGLAPIQVRLDSPARLALEKNDPTFVIAVVTPGDDLGEDLEIVGQWLKDGRLNIVWLLVPEAEIDLSCEQLLAGKQPLGVYSSDASAAEIAALLERHLRPSRSSRKTRAVVHRAHDKSVLAMAKQISAAIFDLIPAIAMDIESAGDYDGTAKGALDLLDRSLARSHLISAAQKRLANLKTLIADAKGTERNKLRRLTAAAEARLATALESARINPVRDAATGDKRALNLLFREGGLALLRIRCRKWAESQAFEGDDLKAIHARADRTLYQIVKRAAAKALLNRTSKADVVGIMIGEASRAVDQLADFESPRGRAADRLEQENIGADSIASPPLRKVILNGVTRYPVADAAQNAGVPLKTVYRWIKNGDLRVHRDGQQPMLVDRAGLEAMRRLAETMARRRRRQDAEDGMLSISDILGITRQDDPKVHGRWRKKALRVARALNIPDRRDRRGDHRYTLTEARRIRARLQPKK